MEGILKSYNPADGTLIGEVQVTPVSEISAVVERAKAAQIKWAAFDVGERIRVLMQAYQVLGAKKREIGTLLSMEQGKDLRRGIGEVSGCAGSIGYVASGVKAAIEPVVRRGYGKTIVNYVPLGVCGIIAPWNYPVSMADWMIVPALTAGNAVVLKPSEETPLVAKAYVDALNEVLPENLLQIIFGDEEQGKALVRSDVDFIGFTGSLEAGKDIMREASEALKPLIMELGGKDPMIVLEDADLDDAAAFAISNSLENAGQMCISTERIFVHESVADEFIKRATAYLPYFKVGAYDDPQAQVGPVINERQRARILYHIEDAREKGAQVILAQDGVVKDITDTQAYPEIADQHPDRYILPTIILGVTDEMLLAKEETFGPLVCITVYDDIEKAIESANSTDYGLGAVVYGDSHAEEVASRLEAGMIGINAGASGGGELPWVGAKMSSFGYHGSPDGHRQFTRPRVMNIR